MRLEKLEKIRKELRLSRRELSEISGVSCQTIQALEQGFVDVYNVKLLTIVELAKALQVKVIDLVPKDLKEHIA